MISRTVLVFCMLLCTGSGSAQVPQTMGYQGLLTDGAGVVVADASYSVTFKIYDMLTGGSLLWTEVHATVSTVNGVFNVILGSMTPLTIAFDKTLYLEITVGANVLTPRIELTGSPYALNARGIVTDASGNVGIGTVSPGTPLAIRGNGGINDVGITQNQVGTASTMELTTRDVAGSQATRILMRGFADAADIEFYRGARGSETLSMHIEGDNGRVGIGTSAPAKELHLTGLPPVFGSRRVGPATPRSSSTTGERRPVRPVGTKRTVSSRSWRERISRPTTSQSMDRATWALARRHLRMNCTWKVTSPFRIRGRLATHLLGDMGNFWRTEFDEPDRFRWIGGEFHHLSHASRRGIQSRRDAHRWSGQRGDRHDESCTTVPYCWTKCNYEV